MAQLTDANAKGANFNGCLLRYADLSNVNLAQAIISNCELERCNLHNIKEEDTDWSGSNRKAALQTDEKKLDAESWQKPAPKK